MIINLSGGVVHYQAWVEVLAASIIQSKELTPWGGVRPR